MIQGKCWKLQSMRCGVPSRIERKWKTVLLVSGLASPVHLSLPPTTFEVAMTIAR
jgi:hypothetical protein